MMKTRLLTLMMLMVFPMASVFATTITNAYQAVLPVVSQADDIRAQAAQAGLLQVLVKVSGDTQIVNHVSVKDSLKNADKFVEEFSYESTTTPNSPYVLKLTYAANQINHILKQIKPATARVSAFSLNVTNIREGKDLSQLLRYIKHLLSVQNVELTEVMGDRVKLNVVAQGDLAAFERQAASLHLVLKSHDQANNVLTYAWVR